jgi:hypothetical protein
MGNAQFRLLCESLGFYSSNSIEKYLKENHGDTSSQRVVDYWLKGQSSLSYPIPEYISGIFLNLKALQQEYITLHSRKNPLTCLYKNEEYFWRAFPAFRGLPCTFLNQIAIQMGLYDLTYFELMESYGRDMIQGNSNSSPN